MVSSPERAHDAGTCVAVTGANGFLGSHIVRSLCRAGHRVVALVRPGSSIEFLKHTEARVVRVDYGDEAALAQALESVEVLVHNAALASDWAPRVAFVEANVETVARVIRAAKAAGVVRLVHISSNAVVGEEDCREAKAEDAPYRPRARYVLESIFPSSMNDYRETKAKGEQQAIALSQAFGFDLTVLRPVWIYGPRERNAGPYEYCQTILSGIPWMPGSRSNRFHAVYVGDVARAVVAVVQRQPPGIKIYHVGPVEAPLQYDYFGCFARHLGVRQPRTIPRGLLLPFVLILELLYWLFRSKTPPLLTRARLEMFYANNVYDTRAITRELAFAADTRLDRGVRLTVRWWRLCGYLPHKKA
jgi:nucleoside-diphosphate-sugar epimerase